MQRFEPPPLPGDGSDREPGDRHTSPRVGRPASSFATPAPPYPSPPGPYATPSSPTTPQDGEPGVGPWGQPAMPAWGAPVPAHPQATTVLVLGILSIVLVPLLGPVAWVMGRKALREVDASPTLVSNRSQLVAGMVLGIISTAMLAIGLFWVLAVIGLLFAAV